MAVVSPEKMLADLERGLREMTAAALDAARSGATVVFKNDHDEDETGRVVGRRFTIEIGTPRRQMLRRSPTST